MTSATPWVQLEPASIDDFAAMAELIVSQCQHPERQCIHSWTRGEATAVAAELSVLAARDELVAWKATARGELLGMIAAELDRGGRCAWIRGPLVREDSDWERVGAELFATLERNLCRFRYRVAVNARNRRAERFYVARGFGERRTMAVYRATARTRAPRPSLHPVGLLAEEQKGSFSALHDTLFPGAYYDSAAIMARTDEDHRVLVVCDGQRVLGYAHVSVADGTGEVEFVGVDPAQRRRGIGRALIVGALAWMFDARGATAVELNVAETHQEAAAPLYKSVGFTLAYAGIALRRAAQSSVAAEGG